MTSDDIEELNWQKSKRVGYTKCLVAAVGCLIEQKNRNGAIWQPTDGDAKDFVIDEIDTALRDVPILGEKLKCHVGQKSKYNTNEKKVFHGATLDIKGGKSAKNFRRMTKDFAIYDETDGFDVDIDKEGSCFELGDGRLDSAPFPKSIRGSTPKTKGVSLIEGAVKKSDKIFYRFVKCPHCGAMQRLVFENLKWDDMDHETAHYVCKENGCVIHYKDYPYMDKNGRWETLDGYFYKELADSFHDPEGNIIEKPKRIGAKIWAAYSYLRPWSYIAFKWISAKRDLKNGNKSTLKTIVNTVLGETYEERGESVESTGLKNRRENYHYNEGIPNEILVVTVGADVQGGKDARIELEILGHGLENETWSIDYVVIPGDPEKQSVWDHLDDQLSRRFTRYDGVELGVAGAFIDSGFKTTHVYRFTGPRRARNIFATKGVNTGTICNKGSWQGDKLKKSRAILRTVNVDEAKETIFYRLDQISSPGPGYCHFPGHYEDKYFDQIVNEQKKEKRKAGRLIGYEWRIIKSHLGNEPLDCRSYNLGILEWLNPNMPKIKLRLENIAERLKLGMPQAPLRKKRRVRSSGLR